MSKQDFINRLFCVLNRGSATDANLFANQPHDDLIAQFRAYLEAHRQHLGAIHLEQSHALNDRGVDLLLQLDDSKVGFQLKSHFDVSQDGFAANVKRQMTESFAHGLDKYLILFCSPLAHGGADYSGRISHLLNELSSFKTPYHSAYGPQNTARFFDGTPALTEQEFSLQIQRFSYRPTTLEEFVASMEAARPRAEENLLRNIVRATATPPRTLAALNQEIDLFTGLNEEQRAETVRDFAQLCAEMEALTSRSRQFLCALVEKSRPKRTFGRPHSVALATEIEAYLSLTPEEVQNEVAVLRRYGFAALDVDAEDGRTVTIEVFPGRNVNWDMFDVMRGYCITRNVPLSRLIVDMEFNLLDEIL